MLTRVKMFLPEDDIEVMDQCIQDAYMRNPTSAVGNAQPMVHDGAIDDGYLSVDSDVLDAIPGLQSASKPSVKRTVNADDGHLIAHSNLNEDVLGLQIPSKPPDTRAVDVPELTGGAPVSPPRFVSREWSCASTVSSMFDVGHGQQISPHSTRTSIGSDGSRNKRPAASDRDDDVATGMDSSQERKRKRVQKGEVRAPEETGEICLVILLGYPSTFA